jgi:hypothetical protein
MKSVHAMVEGVPIKSGVIGDLRARKVERFLKAKGISCYSLQAKPAKLPLLPEKPAPKSKKK